VWKTNRYTNYSFSLLITYGSSYMFRHYIAILRERFLCLLRDGQLWSSRYNIVDGRVVSSDVVCGDLRSPRTTSRPSTIFYRLLLNWASLRKHKERSLRMAI
jgi:hypothetical protein